ncbi:hypothetical protein AVEN_148940-1 [Araneus ventricosus]|uniref:Uncharacterized protein n=1 Tax=Araneus ventricosus TaxID=182803 RepID=A0A4Y2FMC2_ARAVE|nr:hypothetical protein AVEN_148940-1 [Araneus ventricosus]
MILKAQLRFSTISKEIYPSFVLKIFLRAGLSLLETFRWMILPSIHSQSHGRNALSPTRCSDVPEQCEHILIQEYYILDSYMMRKSSRYLGAVA